MRAATLYLNATEALFAFAGSLRLCSALAVHVIWVCCRYAWLKVHGKDARCKKWRSIGDFEHTLFDLWMVRDAREKA